MDNLVIKFQQARLSFGRHPNPPPGATVTPVKAHDGGASTKAYGATTEFMVEVSPDTQMIAGGFHQSTLLPEDCVNSDTPHLAFYRAPNKFVMLRAPGDVDIAVSSGQGYDVNDNPIATVGSRTDLKWIATDVTPEEYDQAFAKAMQGAQPGRPVVIDITHKGLAMSGIRVPKS